MVSLANDLDANSPTSQVAEPTIDPAYATPPRLCATTPTTPLNSTPAIFENDLIAYSTDQASKLAYPVGCPVWYNYDVESFPDTTLSKVRHGKVKAVSMNVATRLFVYKIEKANAERGEALDLVMEDNIAYATSCPVRVTIDGQTLDGEIICPSGLKDFKSKYTTYSVMLFGRKNSMRIEHGVTGEQIKYRPVSQMRQQGEEIALATEPMSPFTCW